MNKTLLFKIVLIKEKDSLEEEPIKIEDVKSIFFF